MKCSRGEHLEKRCHIGGLTGHVRADDLATLLELRTRVVSLANLIVSTCRISKASKPSKAKARNAVGGEFGAMKADRSSLRPVIVLVKVWLLVGFNPSIQEII
jgi:hypothetical protein